MNEALQFILDMNRYNSGNQLRLGMARVRSVDGDPVYGTATGQAIIVPASGEWDEDGVPAYYLGEYPPRPGGACWYASDGRDRIVLGMMAPDGPPYARLRITSATAIVTGTNTTLTLPVVSDDPWNMNSANTALSAPLPGLYDIAAWASWASNATGNRRLEILVNGSNQIYARDAAASGVGNAQFANLVWPLAKGDLVSLRVLQNSGADLNVSDANLSMTLVGRRRTTGAGPEELADGSFEANGTAGWDFTQTTAVYSLSTANPQDGDYCLQLVHGAGSALTSVVYGPDKIPVVPGQPLTVSAYVRGSAAITASGSAGAFPFLLCAPDGLPDPTDSTSMTATSAATASVGTAWAQVSQVQVVPAGCFTARVALRMTTSAANTAFWDNLSVTDKIY